MSSVNIRAQMFEKAKCQMMPCTAVALDSIYWHKAV